MLKEVLSKLPNTKKVLIILSGGMDSTIAMRLAVEKYGVENVEALTFNYGQKQAAEIKKAGESTLYLGVRCKLFDLSFLQDISMGFSANVDKDIATPTIHEVLGDPSPKTYVPNRNMILMSIAAAYAETKSVDTVIMGLQVHDEYGYHDTTQVFVDKVNAVLNENRKIKVKIISPFVHLSKEDELNILVQLDGHVQLLQHTLTCYNPNELDQSCGICPSCSERIQNFKKAGYVDPISYSRKIMWD